MNQIVTSFARSLLGASRDLAPIVLVIGLFQAFVVGESLPGTLSILAGLLLVVVGLALFVLGLDLGLFPLGEALAEEFARKGSLTWLLVFAFALGAGTTVGEQDRSGEEGGESLLHGRHSLPAGSVAPSPRWPATARWPP